MNTSSPVANLVTLDDVPMSRATRDRLRAATEAKESATVELDAAILAAHNEGNKDGAIAREIRMSAPGVTKAIERIKKGQ